jgi:hypothetical protein
MKLSLSLVFFASVGALASMSMGCDGDFNSLTGGPNRQERGGPGEDGTGGGDGLTCTDAPEGRSYVLFDGTKLEQSRENENVGVNRARVKPFAAMGGEFERVLGAAPPSLAGAAGSFDVPAARWYGETQYSAVSLHAMASISYEGCLAYVKDNPAFSKAPTDATARAECSKLMRKAWSRSPSPDEIAGCADLATKTLAEEKDIERRWAYACASVMSASQFLTF